MGLRPVNTHEAQVDSASVRRRRLDAPDEKEGEVAGSRFPSTAAGRRAQQAGRRRAWSESSMPVHLNFVAGPLESRARLATPNFG